MALVSLREVLAEARSGGYAVGAFNVLNLETVQAAIEVAAEEWSPVILQASPGALRFAGAGYLGAMIR